MSFDKKTILQETLERIEEQIFRTQVDAEINKAMGLTSEASDEALARWLKAKEVVLKKINEIE